MTEPIAVATRQCRCRLITVKLWRLDEHLDNRLLDDLQVRGCDWVRDYLQNNPNVSDSDRALCVGITP